MKPAKCEKKKEKSKKKNKKMRKSFKLLSSTADENEKRSSRAPKSKTKKKLVAVDNDDCESSEFEKDVPQTLDNLQPTTYATKPNKESFLTRVALNQELCSSFEHGYYMVVDYQLKTFKTNLFQKGRRMLKNCVQYFDKRPLKFVMVKTFYSHCIANRENFVHEPHANVISHLEHLTPKHNVTILAPSFNFLWYECSRARPWPSSIASIVIFPNTWSRMRRHRNCWDVTK